MVRGLKSNELFSGEGALYTLNDDNAPVDIPCNRSRPWPPPYTIPLVKRSIFYQSFLLMEFQNGLIKGITVCKGHSREPLSVISRHSNPPFEDLSQRSTHISVSDFRTNRWYKGLNKKHSSKWLCFRCSEAKWLSMVYKLKRQENAHKKVFRTQEFSIIWPSVFQILIMHRAKPSSEIFLTELAYITSFNPTSHSPSVKFLVWGNNVLNLAIVLKSHHRSITM